MDVPCLQALMAAVVPAALCAQEPADAPAPAPPVGRCAPAWHPVQWSPPMEGGRAPVPDAFLGEVVLVAGVEHGAARRAAPLLAPLREHLGRGAQLIAITSLPAGAEPDARRGPLLGALHTGHDPGARTAAAYGAAAGPWFALIDRHGILRRVLVAPGAGELERAFAELVRERVNPLIGTPFGALDALRWPARVDEEDGPPPDVAAAEFTLWRWWTDGCPFCRDSLPALARLAGEHRARGLRLVAVYHPKREDPPRPGELRRLLDGMGAGAATLAVDSEWRKLRELLRRGGLERATSVSFLVDRQGRVRWVHPGPRVHGSPDGEHPEAERDLRDLERLLAALLSGGR